MPKDTILPERYPYERNVMHKDTILPERYPYEGEMSCLRIRYSLNGILMREKCHA
ncbi:hypothetical protein LC048_09500 [Mesobacillus subterraneus]|uniref:hypothetical protein n=1 Tax=Mesobacillus subterraneus TaxID=285983 RepID=UPI001CFC486A|nr:hypothetical protein [Mesobacillus subterraneus]WLR57072.1 hypothetical protein LC048_09500 [Mesobacillus subterraneus]